MHCESKGCFGEDATDSRYEYNENGVLIGTTTFYGSLEYTEQTQYTYNELGQKIHSFSITYDKNGKEIDETEIEITYDPDTHLKTSSKCTTTHNNKYSDAVAKSVSIRCFDEYADEVSETSVYDSTSPESDYHNESETVKEYLVSDEIAEMFRSWCRYQAESKLAKKLAKINGTSEEETTAEVTSLKTAETTPTETMKPP